LPLPYHLAQLAALCDTDPAGRKVVFAPSAQIGYAMVNALALTGHSTLNLQIASPEDIARQIAEPHLLASGFRPLVRDADAIAFEPLLRDILLAAPDNPFSRAGLSPGLSRAIHRTLRALRIAGIRPEDLAKQKRDTKLQTLARIYVAYQDLIATEGWYDGADLFVRANELLKTDVLRPADAVAILDETPVPGVAQDFVHSFARGALQRIGRDDEGTPRPTSVAVSCCHLPPPIRAGRVETAGHLLSRRIVPEDLSSITVVETSGPDMEARSAIQVLLSARSALDEAEIAYTAETPYLAAVHNAVQRFRLKATYGAGIPVTFSRPGKALVAFYQWIADDFAVDTLVQACRSGLVSLGAHLERGETLEPYQLATWMLRNGVRVGRHAYRQAVARAVAGEGPPELRNPHLDGPCCRVLSALLDMLPDDGTCSGAAMAAAGRRFLRGFVPFSGEGEAPARDSMLRRLEELEKAIRITGSEHDLATRFAQLISDHRIQAGAPQPGSLNIVPLSRSGYAGRRHLFILGLDESTFPGGATEDPVLLDDERGKVSPDLELIRTRPSEAVWHFVRLLGVAQGTVHLFASTRAVADGRETFPAPLIQQIQDVQARPTARVGGLPPLNVSGLSEVNWLLPRRRHTDFVELLDRRFPWLTLGNESQRARAAYALTRFRGFTGVPDPELSLTARPQSVSRLEVLLQCPYRYFLRHILGVSPFDEGLSDPTRWLTPLQFGDLLHRILSRFMRELTEIGQRPGVEHTTRLREITISETEQHRVWFPEPGPEAMKVDLQRLTHAGEVFLASESKQDVHEPLGFEVSFGFGDKGGLNHPDVIPIDLGDDLQIPLRGLIDRVDRRPDSYAIWDYKTGSAYGYDEADLLSGLHLQWALYGFALEAILKERNEADRPIESGYFFTSDREHGRRIRAILPNRTEVGQLLKSHAALVEEGAFPPIQRNDQCRFCDYAAICAGEQLLPNDLDPLKQNNPDLPEAIATWLSD
jgi:RecB family exonuclease